jgi:hypothetical protein
MKEHGKWTLRKMSFSELGAAFLSFDGDVLLHRQLRFSFFQKKIELSLRWIDHVRTILGLVYFMVHLASSPGEYSIPSQGVPQI